jgi:hypothetical protein
MERALAEKRIAIEPRSYDSGGAMCPLGAADAYAETHGASRLEGSSEADYGLRLVRFAASFDLCAEVHGTERALRIVKDALRAA